MIIWTIGTGGLLGSAITRRAVRNGMATFTASPMPWGDETAVRDVVDADARVFVQLAEDEPWAVLWAAGDPRSASDATAAARQIRALEAVLEAVTRHRPKGRGAFFVSSSAGALYAGGGEAPFAAWSPARPATAFGRLKLAEEVLATHRLAQVCPVVIGRLGNLYGQGQRLRAPKGVLPRLVLGAITHRPVTLSVPLDAIRDFLDADDAAMLALHWTASAAYRGDPGSEVRVIASGQPVTIASLVHLVQQVCEQRVAVTVDEAGVGQHPHDLRLAPSHDATSRTLVRTPLPAGIRRLHADLDEWMRQVVVRPSRSLMSQAV